MIKIIVTVSLLAAMSWYFLSDYLLENNTPEGSVISAELDENNLTGSETELNYSVISDMNNNELQSINNTDEKILFASEGGSNNHSEEGESLLSKIADNPDEFGNERADYDENEGEVIGEYIPLMESEVAASINEYELDKRNGVEVDDAPALPEDVLSSDIESGSDSEIGEYVSTEQLPDNSVTEGEVIGVEIPADIGKIRN
jgi:hypothetical protein